MQNINAISAAGIRHQASLMLWAQVYATVLPGFIQAAQQSGGSLDDARTAATNEAQQAVSLMGEQYPQGLALTPPNRSSK